MMALAILPAGLFWCLFSFSMLRCGFLELMFSSPGFVFQGYFLVTWSFDEEVTASLFPICFHAWYTSLYAWHIICQRTYNYQVGTVCIWPVRALGHLLSIASSAQCEWMESFKSWSLFSDLLIYRVLQRVHCQNRDLSQWQRNWPCEFLVYFHNLES